MAIDGYVFNTPTFPVLVTKLIIKELFCNTIHVFNTISKTFMRQIAATNMWNNIIKQYYGIIETIKVLVIVKNKQFSRTNILIQNVSITSNEQVFFDFKNIFVISICQDDKLVKG